ncbi:carbohydrate ABC transporter permease [Stygiolobus caldivivus]|uniref:carbohydrate ABC transporter permease n=1 Tax=Stygiolobus caldivivus TaxID=2824673 RepID=UPI001CECA383|nr:sugar ABC transporter permease [Stygiolobus caldivivus]
MTGKGNLSFFAFVLPAVIYVTVFSFYPAAEVVWLSFHSPINNSFTLSNFKSLVYFGLPSAIVNTAVVTAGALAIQLFLGMAIASLIVSKVRGARLLYILALIPYGIATVVNAVDFSFIFQSTGGFANGVLKFLGLPTINWYATTPLELLIIIIADSWRNFPVFMLLMLAGYSSIPRELYEAAAVDGAGIVRRFFEITLPNLKKYIAIALIIRGISEFNIFALPLILVGYSPPLLTTLTYEFYSTTITQYYSYAAATILLAFITIFIVIVLKLGGGGRR